MTYTTLSKQTKNSMRLQSIGLVLGSPASEIQEGDNLMWNFGYVTLVDKIISQTEKTITISEISKTTNNTYTRKLHKNRLVCILK